MAVKRRTLEMREFIIDNVATHTQDISRMTAEKFGVSRVAVSKHIQRLIQEGVLLVTGTTKDRKYSLRTTMTEMFPHAVAGLEEHIAWREEIAPLLTDVPKNVLDICLYGFSEMVNNVVDHSESPTMIVVVERNAAIIKLKIIDLGVGVFHKLQKIFNLDDPRHALLELSKGKVTTDSSKHTGQGIFFTSRMFDKFMLCSGTLGFCRLNKHDDWLVEIEDQVETKGTAVQLEIHPRATQTVQGVLNEYAKDFELGFTKTHIPVELLKYGDEQLVSRSQAKRLLTRIDRFEEVLLDFKGINMIGQAFADEIFRVYKQAHPTVHLLPVNMASDVAKTVRGAQIEETAEEMLPEQERLPLT